LGFALDELPLEPDAGPRSLGTPVTTAAKSPGDTAEWLYGAPELAALRDDAPLALDDAPVVVLAAPAIVLAAPALVLDAPPPALATPTPALDAPPPVAEIAEPAPAIPTAVPPQPALPATVLRATEDARKAIQPHATALGTLLRALPARYQELPGYQKAMVIAGAVVVLCLFWRIVH
jgi:hypothetical protein